MDLTTVEILIAILVVALGTAIQAAVGFGLAMVAAPILMLIDRAFVPTPLIIVAFFLVVWMAWKERSEVDTGTVKIAIVGRLIGTPPAALLMGTMSAAAFDLVFGLLVLAAVIISLIHGKHIQPNRQNLFFASMASGFMSTISSIGGPPIALIYQNVRGARLRASLSVYFILGCIMSLTALWLVGRFTLTDFRYAAILLGGMVLGIVLAHPVKQYLDQHSVRPWLLFLCGFSSVIVLLRAWYTW